MSIDESHRTIRRRRALFALWAMPGLTIASWLTRTPDIRDLIRASTHEMGLVLFGVAAGAAVGSLMAGRLVARAGTRRSAAVGLGSVLGSMPTIGAGAEFGSAVAVAVGFALFGLGMSLSEVALNVEGAALEREADISVLPPMHGCYSGATVVGALFGVWCNTVGIPVLWHLSVVAALQALVVLTQLRHMTPGISRQEHTAGEGRADRPRLWKDRRLVLIGVAGVAVGFAEGAATDWLPLLMVDGHDASRAGGSAAFAGFAAAMAIGRFGAGYARARIGPASLLRLGTATAAVGIAGLALMTDSWVVAAAVLLWGMGLSVGLPVALSAASESGPPYEAAARVAFVAVMGYLSYLAGPPLLGFIGEALGLRMAMLVPLGLVVLAGLLAPVFSSRGPRATVLTSDNGAGSRPVRQSLND